MHQYTADLAGQALDSGHAGSRTEPVEVSVVTTTHLPRDRYAPGIEVYTPVSTTNTGLSPESLRPGELRRVGDTIEDLRPDVVHFTGPHLWNVPLLKRLCRAGIPTVHTIHDLDPHSGTVYGRLLHLWNRQVVRHADYILVHGACYRQRLIEQGVDPARVTHTPLCFPFVSHGALAQAEQATRQVSYEPWALFFGRLERYKGVDALLEAWRRGGVGLVIAGKGRLEACWSGPLPEGVEVRNRLIGDEEAIDLFTRCGLVVLPYRDATQSALVAAAYAFRKPVIVTEAGALPEYVEPGRTGWVVPPGDAQALAECLSDALSDPERLQRMGEAGRAWYERERARARETLGEMARDLVADRH